MIRNSKIEYFRIAKKGQFEGFEFNIPNGYHEYLSDIYGDYSELPPEEKRISNHSFIAYQLDGE